MSIKRSSRGCPLATLELMEELQVIKSKADQPFSEKAPINYTLTLIDFYHTLQQDEKKYILLKELLNTLHELDLTDRMFLWNTHIKAIVDHDYEIHESSIFKWSCHSDDNGDGRIISCPVLCEIWRKRTIKEGDNNFHLQNKCSCGKAA
ncbi:MAG: hypothetical protein EOP48_07465 [Sphingobacteriales bacterium]|nr:MAG: hypothetical protein EOP48_07465 [Sphingobacteriales bacterium]